MHQQLNNRKKLFVIFPFIVIILVTLACRTVVPESITTEPILIEPATLAPVATVEVVQLPQVQVDEEALLIALYNKVNPAVVNITALVQQGDQLFPLSEGSGFVFDDLGNILTNAHVVNGADALDVTFADNTTRQADLIGKDFNSDLAVIHVNDLPAGIVPLTMGDINDIQVGQTVVAIGNPFGFAGTMTRGIVSAIGRTIPAQNVFRIPQAIQTDAPINPGNSGGPLLNLKGEVIGVNDQIRLDTSNIEISNSGVGFAVPVSIIKRVVPSLIAEGKYDWAWLGVTGGSLDWATAQAMNLPVERGAYISQIVEDGPASKAGLIGSSDVSTYEGRAVEIGGDVIVAIDGNPIYSFDDLLTYISLNTTPGQEVTLTVLRNGQEKLITVTMESRPEDLSTPVQPSISPSP